MKSRPSFKLLGVPVMVLAVLTASSVWAQSPTKMPKPPVPETHSQQMHKIVSDVSIDSEPMRFLSDLRALDSVVIITRNHLANLTAVLMMNSSTEIEAEKNEYAALLDELKNARTTLASVQVAIETCQLDCAKVELLASKDQAPPANHMKTMAENVKSIHASATDFRTALRAIEQSSTSLSKDPNLGHLIDRLKEAQQAIDQTLALCTSVVTPQAMETGGTSNAPATIPTQHNHE